MNSAIRKFYISCLSGQEPVTAELCIPDKYTLRHPLLVIAHGSGGVAADTEYAKEYVLAQGIATLTIDSFTCRGIDVLSWTDQTSYVSARERAEDIDACLKTVFSNEFIEKFVDPGRVCLLGMSWGADSIIEWHAMESDLPKYHSFLCYGNMWPFKPHWKKIDGENISLYHGESDNWTSMKAAKIFSEQTGAELLTFPNVYHGFFKPGPSQVLEGVMSLSSVDLPVPTTSKRFYMMVKTGQVSVPNVNAVIEFNEEASKAVLDDITVYLNK